MEYNDYTIDLFAGLEDRTLYENKKFVNEKIDKKSSTISNREVHNSVFEDMGFKETVFSDCNFSHNTFINCYFKKTKMWNVNFTGSRFINCNFDGVEINHSDFLYCKFENCFIEYQAMVQNLPAEANLREKLCRNLSMESLNSGSDKDYKKYFYDMKAAGEKNCFETFRLQRTAYYKQKTFDQRVSAFISFIHSKVNKYLWGYGEDVILLCFILLCIVFGFSGAFKASFSAIQNGNGDMCWISFGQSFFISIMNLCTTSAGYYAGNSLTQVLFGIENILGILFLGLFVSVIVKNINRR